MPAAGQFLSPPKGGEVVFNVDCGTAWEAVNDSPDWLTANVNVNSGTLTIVTEQNTLEKERTATVILQTAATGVRFATITARQSAYGAVEISAGADTWHAPAVGALTTEIPVSASAEWDVDNSCEWLTVEKTETGVSVTAAENEETEERTGEFFIVCGDGISSDSITVTVTQDGRAYVTISEETLSFPADESVSTVLVESNFAWDYEYDTSEKWFTVTREGDSLVASVTENDSGSSREAVVVVMASDGAENTAQTQLTIAQSNLNSSSLVIGYNITSDGLQIKLPLSGTVNCTVDWGDGSGAETVTSTLPAHTYAAAGTYDVVIDGTVTELNSYSVSSSAPYVSAVRQWGKTGLTSMKYAFYRCSNLTSLPDSAGDSFEEVTTFSYAFRQCSSLPAIPAAIFADCPAATIFEYAFYDCTSLKAIPETLFEKCSNAESFSNAFYNDTGITEIPENLFANCPEVTTFASTFCNTGIKTIPENLFANCPKVTTFSYTFSTCAALESIPENLFAKCPAVTTFANGFSACTALTSIPEGLFASCPEVTAFAYVFKNCTALASIPEGLFEKNTKATSFGSSFTGTASLKHIPEGLFANCTAVTSFAYVFDSCVALEEIPAGLFANNVNATSFQQSFYCCESLKSIPEGLFANCPKITTFASVFYGCSGLTGLPDGLFDDKTAVTSFASAFRECTGLTSLPENLFATCAKVSNASFVFYGCTALKSLPSDLFAECVKITNFSNTFNGCTALSGESPYSEIEDNGESVKVHLYERANYTSTFSKPTTTTSCFSNCTGLTDYTSIPSAWGGGGN